MAQDTGRHLNCRERLLFNEASRLFYGCERLAVFLTIHLRRPPTGRSTLVDQPVIMPRSVSQPSAKTRITCGTTKEMKSHMSQKCHTRAASKPPNSAASQ